MPYTGPPQLLPSRPEPEQRVVEGSAETTLGHNRTDSPGQAAARLSASARAFAAIVETTGDVQVASNITGFPIRHVDLYA
jgi:hypothetical protein